MIKQERLLEELNLKDDARNYIWEMWQKDPIKTILQGKSFWSNLLKKSEKFPYLTLLVGILVLIFPDSQIFLIHFISNLFLILITVCTSINFLLSIPGCILTIHVSSRISEEERLSLLSLGNVILWYKTKAGIMGNLDEIALIVGTLMIGIAKDYIVLSSIIISITLLGFLAQYVIAGLVDSVRTEFK